MITPLVEPAEVNEAIWRAWIRKGRLQDAALARTFKIVWASGLTLAVLGIAVYFLFVHNG